MFIIYQVNIKCKSLLKKIWHFSPAGKNADKGILSDKMQTKVCGKGLAVGKVVAGINPAGIISKKMLSFFLEKRLAGISTRREINFFMLNL